MADGADGEPPAAQSGPRTSPPDGRYADARALRQEPLRVVQVVDHRDLRQSQVDRTTQRVRRPHEIHGPRGPGRQLRPFRAIERTWSTADNQPGPTAVLSFEQSQRRSGVVNRADRDRIGHRPQRRRERRLSTGFDGEQGGDRSENSRQPRASSQQDADAVPSGQPESQGVPSRRPGRAIAFRLSLRLDQLGDAFDGSWCARAAASCCSSSPTSPSSRSPTCSCTSLKLALGSTSPVAGVVGGGAQPRDLLAGGGRPGTQRIHSTGQGGHAFAAVACGLRSRQHGALGRGEFRLASHASLDRGVQLGSGPPRASWWSAAS